MGTIMQPYIPIPSIKSFILNQNKMEKDPNYIRITKEISDIVRILPVGTIVVAKKNQTITSSGEQYLTAGKEYTIVKEPIYYTFPIEIIDDQGFYHSCALSEFSHYKLK